MAWPQSLCFHNIPTGMFEVGNTIVQISERYQKSTGVEMSCQVSTYRERTHFFRMGAGTGPRFAFLDGCLQFPRELLRMSADASG